jgi:membrane fusion protein (multidrug efflux system)
MPLSFSACGKPTEPPPPQVIEVTVAPVESKSVTLTQEYVCRIDSHHHIEVRAPRTGTLGAISITAGQKVKEDEVLFRIEAANGAEAASVKAPFEGVVGLLPLQEGSSVLKGETLTTLSDNTLMSAYFNVPESRYLEYQAAKIDRHKEDFTIQLMLANGKAFDQPGKLEAIGSAFNAKNGSIRFRADFPNPDGTLHHGQTGVLSVSRVQNGAIVVPQQATFKVYDKRYVDVVDQDDVVHRREIAIQTESDKLFVVKSGVSVGDKIIVDGAGHVADGTQVEPKLSHAGGLAGLIPSDSEHPADSKSPQP